MATFYLRSTRRNIANIWLRIRRDGTEYRLPIGRTINPSLWNSKLQRPQNGKNPQLRADLNDLDKKIEEFVESNHDIDVADLRGIIAAVMGGSVKIKKVKKDGKTENEKIPSSIVGFLGYYITKLESGEMLLSNKTRTAARRTVIGWGTFRGILERFLESYKDKHGCTLKWSGIDASMGQEFITWMAAEGYTSLTVSKTLSKFRSLANLARTRFKLHRNDTTDAALKFTESTEGQLKHAYLSEDELLALYQMELDEERARFRDVFLVMCLSGQRISDCCNISKEDIFTAPDGTKIWRFKQQKTNQIVEVALVGMLGRIFDKYDKMPTVRPIRENEAIKDIMKELSQSIPTLAEHITVTNRKRKGQRSEDGKEAEISVPRWQAISNHSGRRTLITNALDSGRYTMPQIMAMSGHKSISSFEAYISKSRSQLAKENANIQAQAAAEAAKQGKLFMF